MYIYNIYNLGNCLWMHLCMRVGVLHRDALLWSVLGFLRPFDIWNPQCRLVMWRKPHNVVKAGCLLRGIVTGGLSDKEPVKASAWEQSTLEPIVLKFLKVQPPNLYVFVNFNNATARTRSLHFSLGLGQMRGNFSCIRSCHFCFFEKLRSPDWNSAGWLATTLIDVTEDHT